MCRLYNLMENDQYFYLYNTNRKLTIVPLLCSFCGPGKSALLNCLSLLLPGYGALANICKFTFVICHVVFTTMT